MKVRWTQEEIDDASNEKRKHQPNDVIANLLNTKYHNSLPVRTAKAVRAKVNRIGVQRPINPEPTGKQKPPELDEDVIPKVVYDAIKDMPEFDGSFDNELLNLINNPPNEPERAKSAEETVITDQEIEQHILETAAQQPRYQRGTGIVRCPTIKIPETGWFAVVFSSDWHIGNIWTQLLTILYEAKIIAATPGMYMFFGGDSVDGGVPAAPHGGILNEQILPPYWQRLIAKMIFGLVGPKMKAAATGCHAWWSIDAADYDFIHDVVNETECVYMGGGTKYTLKADGGGEWNGVYHHKVSGHSQYNDLHPCVRRALFHEQDADIICVAHAHLSGTGVQVIGEQRRYMARTGARKNFDRYASKIGSDGRRDDLDVPVLLLHATHGRKVKGQWIEGIPMAAVLLTMLRQVDPFAHLST